MDTDADGEVDTFIPGTSRNFAPGWARPGKDLGILHRGAASVSGLEASGSLKTLGSIQVTPQLEVRSLSGGLSETLSVETVYCEGSCHCDEDGNHCQTATTQ